MRIFATAGLRSSPATVTFRAILNTISRGEAMNAPQPIVADSARLWTELPEAAALLAEAIAHPPQAHQFTDPCGDKEWRYIGRIPRRLRSIRADYLEQALSAGDKSRDYAVFARNSSLTVTRAIDEVLERAGAREPFEESFRVGEAA